MVYAERVMAFVEEAVYLFRESEDLRLYGSAMAKLGKLEVPEPFEGEDSKLSISLQKRFDQAKEGLPTLLSYNNLFKSYKVSIENRILLSKMEINIFKTKNSEIKEISLIYKQEFSKPPYSEKWTEKIATEKIKVFMKYADVYTIRIVNNYKEKIVGFFVVNPTLWLPGKIAFGEEIAIKEDFQNKGVGKFCLKFIEEEYRKRGFERVLFISLKESKAFKIYKKLGYKESKSELLMEKDIK